MNTDDNFNRYDIRDKSPDEMVPVIELTEEDIKKEDIPILKNFKNVVEKFIHTAEYSS
mgnify:CR=1 FL=1